MALADTSGTSSGNGRRSLPTRRRFAAHRAIFALMLREMSTTYGRSPGGYIWAVLEPVAAIALLSFVFSYAFRTPPIGNSFVLFYATGYIMLSSFNKLNQTLGVAIPFSRQLLAYPNVTFMDAILARFILNGLTQVLIFLIVMTGVVQLFDLTVILDLSAILSAYAMLFALCFGMGCLNSFLMSMFPVWQQVWSILTRPLFIISGIFFLIDNLPETYRDIIMWNPLAHVIMELRKGFYATYDAVLVSPVYVYGVSAVCGVLGMILLRRYHRVILDER